MVERSVQSSREVRGYLVIGYASHLVRSSLYDLLGFICRSICEKYLHPLKNEKISAPPLKKVRITNVNGTVTAAMTGNGAALGSGEK